MGNQQEPSHEELFREEVRIGISTLCKKMDRLTDTVNGSVNGTKQQRLGLVGILDVHDARIRKLEMFKMKIVYIFVGVGVATGWGIKYIIDHIFKP